jgi:hypothetical protein
MPVLRRALLALPLIAACAPPAAVSAPAPAAPAATPASACCLDEGRRVAERHRVAAIEGRRFTHGELWRTLDPLVRAPGLRVRQVGASVQGRPIRAVTFGTGPTTVLLWSQMHGDESTATMALADVIQWMGAADPAARDVRDRVARELTVVMVPMLNPDGAELFQRENALGVDVNRDARRLATPEARALKGLRDSLRPQFGFNLHDQGARIVTGREGRQVAIALLAPAANERRDYEGARGPARLVAAGIAGVLAQEIPGRVSKYEDDFTPRAFGDLMQQWGTSTVLVESGAMPDDPEKQRLRAVNVVVLVSALDAIASGRWRSEDRALYDGLPTNDRSAYDVVVRGARLVLPGAGPVRVDVALNYDDPLRRTGPRVREVGDLADVVALDTVDADGLFLHPAASSLTAREGGGGERHWLRVGAAAAFTVRRGAEATSEAVRTIGGAR